MALGCNWAKTQGNPPDWCVFWEGNACGRAVYCVSDKQAWKASGFHRWWDLVSAGMQVSETETSSAFPIGEKFDRKDHAVHQGQDRRIWRLLPVQKKEMQTKACKTMVKSVCLLPQYRNIPKLTGPKRETVVLKDSLKRKAWNLNNFLFRLLFFPQWILHLYASQLPGCR